MTTNTLLLPAGNARRMTLEESRAALYAAHKEKSRVASQVALQKQKEKEEKKRQEFLNRHKHIDTGKRLGGESSNAQVNRAQRQVSSEQANPEVNPAVLLARARQQMSYNMTVEQQKDAQERKKQVEMEREKAKKQAKLERYSYLTGGQRLGNAP